MIKKIVFLTGTRADFGKLKSLIHAVDEISGFEYSLFVTGMHLMERYGNTYKEIESSGFKNIHKYFNQHVGEPMEMILANTIHGLSRYIQEVKPDMLVIHGDRVEALAGAIVGSMNNIRVAHIEGGERSGTIDELLRHSITKLSHLHLVANQEAQDRVIQLGESPESVFIIGSADIDYMKSDDLPALDEALTHYEIPFREYNILLFHPVTTEIDNIGIYAQNLVDAVIRSGKNFIVVFPNNDTGTDEILYAYEKFKMCPNIRVFPSLKFEMFLTLLHHANFLLGNSSAGIREAPIFGIPSINIGTRQSNRFKGPSIFDCGYSTESILDAIEKVSKEEVVFPKCEYFGSGDSAVRFKKVLESSAIWKQSVQKKFNDISQ